MAEQFRIQVAELALSRIGIADIREQLRIAVHRQPLDRSSEPRGEIPDI